MRHIVHVHQVLGHEVDAPQARVRVARRERHEAVREVVRRHDVRQPRRHQPRRAERAVPVSEDALHHEHREVVGRAPADALDRDRDVRGGKGIVTDADLRTNEVGFGVGETAEGDGVGGDGEVSEVLLGVLDELLVVDAAGADEDHAVGGVICLDVRGEVIALDGENVLLGAKDGAPERLACKT